MPAIKDMRSRLLAECANNIWALRPEALAVLQRCVADQLAGAEAREQVGLQTVGADEEPETRPTVALIPLQGIITPKGSFFEALFGGGGGLQYFRAALRQALADPAIESIVLDIDSPGGLHTMVPEAAADVLAARAVKPVVAVANAMAASAAYYVGSQADELIITPSGVVGSIGVCYTHEDWSKYDERLGIKTTFITAGRYKAEGNSAEPLGDEARAHIQGEAIAIYAEFLEAVAVGRATTVDDVRENYGEARCLRAAQALDVGMVDGIETLEQVLARVLDGDIARKTKRAPAKTAAAARAPELAPVMLARAGAVREATFAAQPRTAAPAETGQGIAWVTGAASVFGSRNTFGEAFVPGAFADSVADTANPLPMVDMHRQAIGSWNERTEDLAELALAGPISDTQAGREMATLLQDRALNGLSVGFLPLEVHLAAPGETASFDTPYGSWSCTHDSWTLYVIRARLAEVSIVYAPADDEARVTNVSRMSAEQLGTALPGVRPGAAWEDVAWSMCRLMGAPGGGLVDLLPEERQSLHNQLRQRYAEHGKTAPVFAATPDYRATTFHAGEPALYQDRSLGKRCADVKAAIGGTSGRPLSDGTRTRAIEARDAINRLLDPEPPEDPPTLDAAAVAAELGRVFTSLES